MGVYDSIVITGGGGMLAHALVESLRLRGLTAVAVGRSDCDISRREGVVRLYDRYRPTLLLNCAAHTKVDLCEDEPEAAFAANGAGPGYIAELAKAHGTVLAHFSTDFVFDGKENRPYLTTDRPAPLSVYGKSKLEGERQVALAGPPGWMVVRTSWLFGPQGHCFPRTILKVARSGQPLAVVDDQYGCPTFSMDLASTTLDLVAKRATGIFHVTGSGKTSWYEFAKRTLEVFELDSELKAVSTESWLSQRPKQAKRPKFSVLDCSQTTIMTGKKMAQWEEALQRYRQVAIGVGSS